VPLEQTFIGVTEHNKLKRLNFMNDIAYEKAMGALRRDKQAMIFVHSRRDTAKTARTIAEMAAKASADAALLAPIAIDDDVRGKGSTGSIVRLRAQLARSSNSELRELAAQGLGIHHAGMLRSDRTLVEQLFYAGEVKILVCTATLAWGVNLPANTVIIKGTEVYNAEVGGFTDLSILDVQQIFGRAGRPQFDSQGHA